MDFRPIFCEGITNIVLNPIQIQFSVIYGDSHLHLLQTCESVENATREISDLVVMQEPKKDWANEMNQLWKKGFISYKPCNDPSP